MENYFTNLSTINVNDKVEKKNGLTYLSWSFAWGELKKKFPDATYKIYEHDGEFGPVNYFTDGRTAWVKTGVTVNGIEHIEELPVMNNRNQSLLYDEITSVEVNKTIQRSLTKAIARHGLGLYIYAGEDLPGDASESITDQATEDLKAAVKNASLSAGNGEAAPTVGKDAVKPVEATNGAQIQDLGKLIKDIGGYAKKIKAKYGDLTRYQEVITKVTGNANFKCNVATEDDIPTLEAILAELQKNPDLQ